MEQPPGSLDELQPQDLSACSIPTVIDLTRNGEECVLNASSLEALRIVKSPGWYPNSGTSKTGLPFSETASPDIRLQSGDQIQPDDAFSNTTVTLSYVSRSHVFSAHDSLSQHPSLYGVPSISRFSLHPPCESEKGLGEAGYALSQHYLEQLDRPMDLASQTELFQSLAQVAEESNAAVCLTQQSHEFNGRVVSSDGHLLKCLHDGTENIRGLENGQGDGQSCTEVGVETLETLAAVTGEHQDGEGPEILLLISKTQEPAVVPHGVGARDVCLLSREYISPLEDPVSPSATSLDDVEDVFILPQASSSPSADKPFLEVSDEALWEGLNRPGPVQPSVPGPRSSSSDGLPGLDPSNEHKSPVRRRKAVLEPMIDVTDFLSDVSDVIPHMNGNARPLQRTVERKKLPVRSGRGTRLEAIVMNIHPSRYKVSGCVRTSKKATASQTTTSVSKLASPQKSDHSLAPAKRGQVKAAVSVKKTATPHKRSTMNSINTDSCKGSTSDSEIISNSKNSRNSTPPKHASPQCAVHKKSKKEPEGSRILQRSPQSSPESTVHKSKKNSKHVSLPEPSPESLPLFATHTNSIKERGPISEPHPSPEIQVARVSSPPKSPKKSPTKHKGTASSSKASPCAKAKAGPRPKRRRKKHQPRQSSSMFSPREPEIKLKYVTYKEEKRDHRLDSFSPFVRVERKPSPPSLCTLINYPEQAKPQHKKGHAGGFMSGVIPSTSCLQLGRASTRSQHQRCLVCCLCGQSANAMDLGDLHGPYYPEGYRHAHAKNPAGASGLKEDEEDYSDTDSSTCSVGGRGRKGGRPPAPWQGSRPTPSRPGSQLKQEGLLGGHSWSSNGDNTSSPPAKRARTDAISSAVEDWYSPPVVPQEPCEYWLHEDCSIWSAGVFLVKGKVYGLEEAVKVAQETMCSCCCNPGATLGCFFKGCPNKYHYRCAVESDCVLIEENFSMRCKKHKNKTFKAPPGSRWEDR